MIAFLHAHPLMLTPPRPNGSTKQEVLEETDLMLPDVQKRLVAFKGELQALLDAWTAVPAAPAEGEEAPAPVPVEITNAHALLAEMGVAEEAASA